MQEHRYYFSELDLKYDDTDNEDLFSYLHGKAVDTTIGDVRMLLSPYILKSLNSIEKTQQKEVTYQVTETHQKVCG